MSESLNFPPPDRNLDDFRQWARYHFRHLHDPLRHRDLDHYWHESVELAWTAWKAASEHVAAENAYLRKVLERYAATMLEKPLIQTEDPKK